MKVLVTGADGQLGRSLSSISENFAGAMLFVGRKEMDICNAASIRSNIESFKPDYITAVDKAENEKDLALEINRDALINIIKETESIHSKIIHISTDYVFNGENEVPYAETDTIDPRSVYGKTKAEGEKALLAMAKDRCMIIRTSWLYSEFGHNFLKTMLRLGQEKQRLNVVSDQIGIPTYTRDLAKVILKIIALDLEITSGNQILHFSNSGESNWYEFAKEIMEVANLNCEINAISTSEYPTPAKRPKYSVLSTDRIEKELGIEIRHWKIALRECFERLKKINK